MDEATRARYNRVIHPPVIYILNCGCQACRKPNETVRKEEVPARTLSLLQLKEFAQKALVWFKK